MDFGDLLWILLDTGGLWGLWRVFGAFRSIFNAFWCIVDTFWCTFGGFWSSVGAFFMLLKDFFITAQILLKVKFNRVVFPRNSAQVCSLDCVFAGS